MSDVSQGPGWWYASDGKWYPPEQAPGPAPAPAAPTMPPTGPPVGPPPYESPAAPPAYGVPVVPPAYPPGGDPAYGYPPGGPPYGYAQGQPAYGYVPIQKTNGLAIASLVCSFFFWLYGVGAVLAIVFGFIARSQIKRSEGNQRGGGMALAGIIIGFAGLVILVVAIIVVVAVVHHCDQTNNCTFNTTFGNGNGN
jgi:Domain of unknown function (DUF4190)